MSRSETLPPELPLAESGGSDAPRGVAVPRSDPAAESPAVDTGAGAGPGGYVIRTRPEDFVVVEEPLYPASGTGGHTFLEVEKRGRTTEQIAGGLARSAGVRPRDVGYAGRKDRHAVTRQWFSLPGVDPAQALDFALEEARVLQAVRHGHKLRTGQLRANRFEIALRGSGGADLAVVQSRAAELVRRGLPNRYGDQRFGSDGDNVSRARRMLDEGRPPRDRRAARFLLSALQSAVFNAVLDERIDAYDDVEEGDLARVEASGGLFWVDDPVRERPRAARFEISATGPIFGPRARKPRARIGTLEADVLERFGLPPDGALPLPRGLRARGGRRPLRIRPEALQVDALDGGDGLRVRCALPPGAYVTVLLSALVGPVRDASRSPGARDGSFGARVSSPGSDPAVDPHAPTQPPDGGGLDRDPEQGETTT